MATINARIETTIEKRNILSEKYCQKRNQILGLYKLYLKI